MSAGQYINAFEKKQNRKKFINQWQVVKNGLTDVLNFCEDEYEENVSQEREQLDNLFDEKKKSFNSNIDEAFHNNLDEMRNDFLDKYNELSISDVGLIYQFVEFQKSKS